MDVARSHGIKTIIKIIIRIIFGIICVSRSMFAWSVNCDLVLLLC